MSKLHYAKESKSRCRLGPWHPIIKAAIKVLEQHGGGPLSSVDIWRRGMELKDIEPNQRNSVRARLSQYCCQEDALIVRASSSTSARTSWWVLAETGLGMNAKKKRKRRRKRKTQPKTQQCRRSA